MCEGILVPRLTIPDALVADGGLNNHIVTPAPGADPIVQFLYRDQRAVLPVWWDGQLRILPWGNRNKASKLPRTGCCWQENLDAGRWGWLRPEAVEIPACCGFEKGVWSQVQEGLHGVAVRDEHGQPHAYVITQPATHYYAIMTRSERMPVLLNQTI